MIFEGVPVVLIWLGVYLLLLFFVLSVYIYCIYYTTVFIYCAYI